MDARTFEHGLRWMWENGVPADPHVHQDALECRQVAALNSGREPGVEWIGVDSFVKLENVRGTWSEKLFWAVDADTGVLAAWQRDKELPMIWVSQLLAPHLEQLSPEVCVEIAQELVKLRAPDMGTAPTLNEEGTYSTQEWDDTLQAAWTELKKIDILLSNQTVHVNDRGPHSWELSAIKIVRSSLAGLRRNLEETFSHDD